MAHSPRTEKAKSVVRFCKRMFRKRMLRSSRKKPPPTAEFDDLGVRVRVEPVKVTSVGDDVAHVPATRARRERKSPQLARVTGAGGDEPGGQRALHVDGGVHGGEDGGGGASGVASVLVQRSPFRRQLGVRTLAARTLQPLIRLFSGALLLMNASNYYCIIRRFFLFFRSRALRHRHRGVCTDCRTVGLYAHRGLFDILDHSFHSRRKTNRGVLV